MAICGKMVCGGMNLTRWSMRSTEPPIRRHQATRRSAWKPSFGIFPLDQTWLSEYTAGVAPQRHQRMSQFRDIIRQWRRGLVRPA